MNELLENTKWSKSTWRNVIPLELANTEFMVYNYWYWLNFIKHNSN